MKTDDTLRLVTEGMLKVRIPEKLHLLEPEVEAMIERVLSLMMENDVRKVTFANGVKVTILTRQMPAPS